MVSGPPGLLGWIGAINPLLSSIIIIILLPTHILIQFITPQWISLFSLLDFSMIFLGRGSFVADRLIDPRSEQLATPRIQ